MRSPQRDREEKKPYVPSEDDSMVAECYRLYAPRLFAYLCAHARAANDAEDMLFEVFLVVLEHEQGLARMPEDEQRAWLWTIARNKLIDYHRRLAHHRMIPLESLAEMIDEDATPDEVALLNEEYRHLRAQLKQLPVLQQEVLELRFTAGLRCAEIATVLNKKEGAIRTMISRALNTLRGMYGS